MNITQEAEEWEAARNKKDKGKEQKKSWREKVDEETFRRFKIDECTILLRDFEKFNDNH